MENCRLILTHVLRVSNTHAFAVDLSDAAGCGAVVLEGNAAIFFRLRLDIFPGNAAATTVAFDGLGVLTLCQKTNSDEEQRHEHRAGRHFRLQTS